MATQAHDGPESPRRLETIKDRMRGAFVDDEGNPPPDDELAAVVEETAAHYEDAPIQDFTTLLTEHDARDALRDRGLHARLGGSPDGDGDGVDDHEAEAR